MIMLWRHNIRARVSYLWHWSWSQPQFPEARSKYMRQTIQRRPLSRNISKYDLLLHGPTLKSFTFCVYTDLLLHFLVCVYWISLNSLRRYSRTYCMEWDGNEMEWDGNEMEIDFEAGYFFFPLSNWDTFSEVICIRLIQKQIIKWNQYLRLLKILLWYQFFLQ